MSCSFDELSQIAVINLLFAQAEIETNRDHDAISRALYHVEQAEGCLRLLADELALPASDVGEI
jgi:hypothetical protein